MPSPEGRSGPLLLDTNALLALAWPNHQYHREVVARLERQPGMPWATCALTQVGFVRLSSNPAVVGIRKTPRQSLAMLSELVSDGQHRYLETLPSLPSVKQHFQRLLGHNQVTDAYLLAVAATNRAVLLTLDRRIAPSDALRTHIEVVSAGLSWSHRRASS